MKTLHVPMDDAEYKKLEDAKGDMTWKEFLLQLVKKV